MPYINQQSNHKKKLIFDMYIIIVFYIIKTYIKATQKMASSININEYDTGIEDVEMSIMVVESNVGFVKLEDDEMVNPLFVNVNNDLFTNQEHNKHKNVFVICTQNNFTPSDKKTMYDKIVKKDKFEILCSQLRILKSPISLLYNVKFKNNTKLISGELLKKMFGNEYEFDNEELVLILFELSENMAKLNNSLYNSYNDITELLPIVQLTSFYNETYKKPIISQFSKRVENFKIAQFWTKTQNCENINMTEVFNKRGFEYKTQKFQLFKNGLEENKNKNNHQIVQHKKKYYDYLHGLNEQVVQNEQEIQIMQNNEKIQNNDEVEFKPKQLTNTREYQDIITAIRNSDKRTYYINNNLEIDQKYINDIFSIMTNEEEIYYVLNMMLVSKDYCHMVLTKEILDKVTPLINKHLPLYKYTFGYAWLALIIEESIMKTKMKNTDRFIFDIDTASKLPYFPLTYDDIYQNPYVILPVDVNKLDVKNNNLSLPHIKNGNECYGVCDFNEFKKRRNIFMTGNQDLFPLDGIDWNNFAISGSLMTACLQKESQLFKFANNNSNLLTNDMKWKKFFDTYYSEADIDLICKTKSTFDFFDSVENVINVLDKNLGEKSIVEHHKSMATFVTNEFFIDRLNDFNEKYGTNYTSSQMCDLATNIKEDFTNNLQEYLYTLYIPEKFKENNYIRDKIKNKKTNSLTKYLTDISAIKDLNINFINVVNVEKNKEAENDNNEICLYVNDFRTDNFVPDDKNHLLVKFSESHKFKIKNSKLLHQIELFRTQLEDFFGIVGKFHLPCVRAYNQGDKVYLTPSCITAMQTGINIDYKYFAGSKDPIDIINKYRMRGFSTLLSDAEKEYMKKYNSCEKACSAQFLIKQGEKNFGVKFINDKIFNPQNLQQPTISSILLQNQQNQIGDFENFKKYYAFKYNYVQKKVDMFKCKTINDRGFIEPYEPWVTQVYWKSVNN